MLPVGREAQEIAVELSCLLNGENPQYGIAGWNCDEAFGWFSVVEIRAAKMFQLSKPNCLATISNPSL
jgi:hypothetical protein